MKVSCSGTHPSLLRALAAVGTLLVAACGGTRDDGSGAGTGGEGGTSACGAGTELPAPAGPALCVQSSAFGELYLESADAPDGFSVVAFGEPKACDYFAHVENVLEEQGDSVTFGKLELLGSLPGTCPVDGNEDVQAPTDGTCVAIVRTRRYSQAGKQDILATSGKVVVWQRDAATLKASVEVELGATAATLTIDAGYCPAACACLASVPSCPCPSSAEAPVGNQGGGR